MSIPQLSEAMAEIHYVAKLQECCGLGGFINSNPGNIGGYTLAKPANEIIISDLLKALGGSLFDAGFCGLHSGNIKFCTNSVDCSSRSLWQLIQLTVDRLLHQITLQDLVGNEEEASKTLGRLLGKSVQPV